MITFEPNRSDILLSNIGSFWSDVFGDRTAIDSIYRADLLENEQTLIDTLDTIACLSRFDVPLFKRDMWRSLKVKRSEMLELSRDPRLYDDGSSYGGEIVYGQTSPSRVFRVPVPTDLMLARQIVNGPAHPTTIWVNGVDYHLDTENHVLELLVDPFEGDFLKTYEIQDDVEEEFVTLWLFNSDLNLNYIYEQFGYVLGLYLNQGSESYRNVISAFWGTLRGGSNALAVRTAIASLAGVTVVREAQETVEAILEHPERLQIVTDAHTYDFPPTAVSSVSAGDVVYAGDILITGLQFIEGSGFDGDLSGVQAIAIEPGHASFEILGSLMFHNDDLATTLTYDADGHAVVTFPVGGFAADVERFWEYTTAAGKATGYSVAQALRTEAGTGEPLAAQIPATVNPMQFLLDAGLRHNLVVVVLDVDQLSLVRDARSLIYVRRLLPPHVQLVFLTTLSFESAYNEGEDLSLSFFLGDSASAEALDLTTADDSVYYLSIA